jgi:hypothetical protein
MVGRVFCHFLTILTTYSRTLLELVMAQNDEKEYATIQVRKSIKGQIVDHCNLRGLKIGRYIENLFLQDVSGSIKP